jgi:tetratricopeptide (TPR) repeat protein
VPDSQSFVGLLILWAAAAAAYGLVHLARRARRIERELGLHRSNNRLNAAIVMCSLVTLVALVGTINAFRLRQSAVATRKAEPASAEPAPPGPGESGRAARPDAAAEQLAALEQERKQLEEKLAELRRRIEFARRPAPNAAAAPPRQAPGERGDEAPKPDGPRFSVEVPILFPALAVFAVLVGLVLLFTLGDPEVLLRFLLPGTLQDPGELRLRALTSLDRLAAAADRGDFRDGLAHADAIDSHLLDKFERMNWLFLRGYCAVQYALADGTSATEREEKLAEAVRGITAVLESAPNNFEAVYLLALAQGFQGETRTALERFNRAESGMGKSDLPFAHNKSVCLLRLAEEGLGKGDAEEAGRLFDQVTKLNVLADRIPSTLVRVRLSGVRRDIQAGRLDEAVAGIETVRNLSGVEPEQRQNVEVVCDALQTLVSVRRQDDALALGQIDEFLKKHAPANLPEPDEETADEYLEAPVRGFPLRLEPQVFRAFLFLKAAALARTVARTGKPPSAVQTNEITRSLLTALQFELRQRDVLAALGGVYYWFVPQGRRRALDWMEAAVSMGVESSVVRRLLERYRRIETENREAMEWFRSTAGQFLHDPTVSAHVREVLVEELGRFQGFQPLLLELDRPVDLDAQEATVRILRERAVYLQQLLSEFAVRKPDAIQAGFEQLRQEYARLLATLDASTGRMAEIERLLIQEVGKTVLA